MVLVVLIPTSIMLYILIRYKTFLGEPIYSENDIGYTSYRGRSNEQSLIFWMVFVIGICMFMVGLNLKSLLESRKYMKEHPESNGTEYQEVLEDEEGSREKEELEEKEESEE